MTSPLFKLNSFKLLFVATLTLSACTSKFQETPASDTVPEQNRQERLEAQKKWEEALLKVDKTLKDYKNVLDLISSLFQTQPLQKAVELLQTVNQEALQSVPYLNPQREISIHGKMLHFGSATQAECRFLDYSFRSEGTELIYELKSCYSKGSFFPILKIDLSKNAKMNIIAESWAQLFPADALVKSLNGCTILPELDNQLACDDLLLAQSGKSYVLADIREIPEAYLVTLKLFENSETQKPKIGFLRVEKSGKIGDVFWSED
ncbi:MAG: hypothetical protein ACAH59_00455 [Pseudobdellovibrionaceae bacterium]